MVTNKPGNQSARILNALKDGKWISVSEIHRRAGISSGFNARITQLRKEGWKIENRIEKGKSRASLASQYRLMKPWPVKMPKLEQTKAQQLALDRDSVPRDKANRHRLYVVDERNELLLMATAPTISKAGAEIYRLGKSGALEGACVGWLDTMGVDKEKHPGTWILNPFDPKTT